MGMCCSDEQKKGSAKHGPDQNPFRNNKSMKGKTDKMVIDAIETAEESFGSKGVTVQETVIVDNRVEEQLVEGGIQE